MQKQKEKMKRQPENGNENEKVKSNPMENTLQRNTVCRRRRRRSSSCPTTKMIACGLYSARRPSAMTARTKK